MEKFEKLGKRIKELKEEKEEWKSKYKYMLEELRKLAERNSNKITELGVLTKGLGKKDEKNDQAFSELRESLKLLNKSLTDLKNKQALFREKVFNRVGAAEKIVNSEDRKFEGIKEDVDGRMEEFKRSYDEQKESVDDLEKKLVIELGQIRMERENLFKDFTKIISDFKDLEGGIERLRETDSDLDHRIQNVENEGKKFFEKLESFRKDFSDMLEKLKREFERREKDKKKEFEGMMKEFLIVKSQADEKLNILSSQAETMDNLKNDMEVEIRKGVSGEISEGLEKIEEKIKNSVQDLEQAKLDFMKTTDDLRKEVNEKIVSLDSKHRYFEEAVITKLKDANDNILGHLKESEERMNKALVENIGDIKNFKEHITNFVNDLVDNYERRFEVLKDGLDEISRNVQAYKKGVSALVFE
jgi:chromosome segregation ATPase